MLPVELLAMGTYALGVLTGTLYGENRESVSQTVAPHNMKQTVAPHNMTKFEHSIAQASNLKHIHPDFLADIESSYYNMTVTHAKAVGQARAETDMCKTSLKQSIGRHQRSESQLRTAQMEIQFCLHQIVSIKKKNEACEKGKDEVLECLRDWSAAERKRAVLVEKYPRRNK